MSLGLKIIKHSLMTAFLLTNDVEKPHLCTGELPDQALSLQFKLTVERQSIHKGNSLNSQYEENLKCDNSKEKSAFQHFFPMTFFFSSRLHLLTLQKNKDFTCCTLWTSGICRSGRAYWF